MTRPIYADYNASTPPDPAVVEAMLPWLGHRHCNPHSSHLAGRRATAAIEKATEQVAALIGCDPMNVIFTSGATESNNLAIRGLLDGRGPNAKFLYSAIEHKAVLEVAPYLRSLGTEALELPVDSLGFLRLEEAERLVTAKDNDFLLVSTMHANNEIGTIQPIEEIAAIVAKRSGYIHVDAAQSVGKVEIDVQALGIDLMSISAHKLYGPAGIGALYVAPHARKLLQPLFFGGGQQSGLRPGTMPLFLIVGFGAACALSLQRMTEDADHAEKIADVFCRELARQGVEHTIFDCGHRSLPGLRSVRLTDVEGDDVVAAVAQDVSISTGSACSGGHLTASHVLRAVGMSEWEARQVIRVGFGRPSTVTDATNAAMAISAAAKRLREIS